MHRKTLRVNIGVRCARGYNASIMDTSPAHMVKEKLHVLDVLKGYIEVQQAGRNFKALCPFHHEKSPSFMISPDRDTWHCFGCGEGGDIFTFVMKYENVEFGEALKILAEKAGIELRRVSPMEYKHFGLLYDLNAAARDFYRKMYVESPLASDYLKTRGLAPETIEEFEVGWASQGTDELSRHLVNLGYASDDILRAGLAVKSDRGRMFDRFRGRIMFPIWNHSGKVVGFTGRILPQFDTGDMGKYVNSPETPIFQKSKLLYGFSKVKNAVRDAGMALLVEGQMDMLMVWQAGVKNVVATSGTALTGEHLHALRRLAGKVVLSFDNDSAGYAALERAIDLAESLDFGVKIAVVEGYKDAAEAVQADPGSIAAMVEKAKPAAQFYFDRYLPRGAGDLRDRDYLLKLRRVLAKLKGMASAVERSAWLQDLAERTGINEPALVAEMERIEVPAAPAPRASEAPAGVPSRKLSRWELLAERTISAAAAKSDFTLGEDVVPYFPEPYAAVWSILKGGGRKAEDPDLDRVIDAVLLVAEDIGPAEFEELKNQLRKEGLRERRLELTMKVKQAQQSGNEDLLNGAMEELQRLPTY
jgi:DNA primase